MLALLTLGIMKQIGSVLLMSHYPSCARQVFYCCFAEKFVNVNEPLDSITPYMAVPRPS